MEAEVEAKVEAYIDGESGEIPLAKKEAIGRTVDYAAGRNRYIGHLISLATRSFKEVKVGLDCSNGSSSSIAKSVFDALGAKTYVINNEPDGTNINTNCGSTHINVLQEYVKKMVWMSDLHTMEMRTAASLLMRMEMLLTGI